MYLPCTKNVFVYQTISLLFLTSKSNLEIDPKENIQLISINLVVLLKLALV